MGFVGHAEDNADKWGDLVSTIARDQGKALAVDHIDSRLRSGKRIEVFLLGRMSGATAGRLNHIRDGVRTTYLQKNGSKRTVVSREYVVLDYAATNTEYARKVPAFSQGGDSGSPIFDRDGLLVGMLFAGHATDESGYPASWMSPAEKILAHIQTAMGNDPYSIALI